MSAQRRRSRRSTRISKDGIDLIDQLIEYLGDQIGVQSQEQLNGITLPAHAIDWLSRNMIVLQAARGEEHEKWTLLRALLPHAKKIRVIPDPWPKKPKRTPAPLPPPSQPPRRPADVNLILFPCLQVLWLDRVPLEWLSNVETIRKKLTVLRVTQIRIGNLQSTPLLLQNSASDMYPSLSHLKLAHCCLGEQSGLQSGDPAPLARLSRSLRSLSLAHNDIETEATALAGLAGLPELVKLDLSFNRITALPRIHTWLSNIETLNLSHNSIESVAGIERLFSLRSLSLDNNSLRDLEQTANCLAGLHNLTELHLKGNPEFANDYRLIVLNSFRERRFSTLEASSVENLTLRAVRSLLPVLDGRPATADELRTLRKHSCARLAVHAAPRQGRKCRRRKAVILNGSTPPSKQPARKEHCRKQVVLFTAADVIAAAMANPLDGIPESLLHSGMTVDVPRAEAEMSEHETCLWEQLKENIGDSYRGSIDKQVVWPGEEKERKAKDTISSPASVALQLPATTDETSIAAIEELATNSVSTAKEENEMKASGTTTVTTTDTRLSDRPSGLGSSASVSSIRTPGGMERSPARSAFSTPGSSQNHISFQLSSDNLWHDDAASVPSSLGVGMREGSPMSKREAFRAAENNAKYEGSHVHRRLIVRKHLELYFRVFVFTPLQATPDVEEPWHEVLRIHPKIQLWPVDRKNREIAFQNSRTFSLRMDDDTEAFRYVWKEKIVACGKNALRRLTPLRKLRYGFHGEQLWLSDDAGTPRPDVTIEARDVICCCSDRCFYIIADHDGVTAATKNGTKSFPVPIPKKGTFKDAKWPHALACHQFDSLEQVTLGFGFQRITLHFSCASTPGGFTYILLTSSKMKTVSLFKQFQELSSNAKEIVIGSPGPKSTLGVENDDPYVLDAISDAISPDSLGVVLRYQILLQRWKHGERGSVRRVCVLTDLKLYLLDEDYAGDGSCDNYEGRMGECKHRLVDSTELSQISEVQAADADPKSITIVIAVSAFARSHNWRLVCPTGENAEKLVEDVRKAIDQLNA